MLSNRKVESLILGSEFLIDLDFGFKSLLKYLNDLSLVESGVSIKDMGYKNDPMASVSIINQNGNVSYSTKEIQNGSIAKIGINGVMQMNGGISTSGIADLAEVIQSLDANPAIAGFKFDVNTGGGEATAGMHLYNTLKDMKKPKVAQFHMMASAGYLGMLPVDEMIALSTASRAGSIGAMISLDKKFIDWYKENIQDIYSTMSSGKNDEWNALLNGDTSKMINSLDTLVSDFHSKVLQHRTLKDSNQVETLQGKTFYAKDAKSRGLIDSIGTEAYATKRLNFYIKNSIQK
jgi:ClpP class serine protease